MILKKSNSFFIFMSLDNFNQFPFKYQSKMYHSIGYWTEQRRFGFESSFVSFPFSIVLNTFECIYVFARLMREKRQKFLLRICHRIRRCRKINIYFIERNMCMYDNRHHERLRWGRKKIMYSLLLKLTSIGFILLSLSYISHSFHYCRIMFYWIKSRLNTKKFFML